MYSHRLPGIRSANGRLVTDLAVLLVLAAFLTLVVPPPTVLTQESVSLTGQVANGTAGGAATDGLTVLLLVLDGGGGLISTGQTTTGTKGEFEIMDVPVVAGGSYLLDVEYKGAPYQVILSEEQLLEQVRLTVYETSTQVSVIRLKRQVMVITGVDPQAREITAMEFVRVFNPGDRTVVPDLSGGTPMGFLRFSLPPESTDLSVNSDLPSREIISVGTGFAVTSPISPGDHSIEFSYRFPFRDGLFSYRQNLLQGAEIFQVMAPQEFTQLQVSPLTPVETVDIQGTQYRVWEASNLAPGEGFVLELANLPRPSLVARVRASISNTGFWTTSIPTLMGAVLASLLLFAILTKPPSTAPPVHPSPVQIPPESGLRADLVRELAILDQLFESGEMPEEEYQTQRQRLKSQILGSPDDPGGSP